MPPRKRGCSFEYIMNQLKARATPDQLETLKQRTFWGPEKENLIYPIALVIGVIR